MERVLAHTRKDDLEIGCRRSDIGDGKSVMRNRYGVWIELTILALPSRKSPENIAFIMSQRAVRIALCAGKLPSSKSNTTSANSPENKFHFYPHSFQKVVKIFIPCSRQSVSNLCLTICLNWLLRSLFMYCSRDCMLFRTISSCGSSRNSAACLISCWQKCETVESRQAQCVIR